MSKKGDYIDHRKYRQTKYFKRFSKYHIPWMQELIAAYKERGQFPLFPTFIANYYEDKQDKELAIIATMCLNWNRDVLSQIQRLRELMGEHPHEWFRNRGFVVLSIAKNQETMLMEDSGSKYWKVAKFFSELYDKCRDKTLRKVFANPGSFMRYIQSSEFGLGSNVYKASVIELVLRASDGFSFGLWPTTPSRIKTPVKSKIKTFLGVWFPDYAKGSWDFEEAVSIFGLEKNYDFFYFYLAWEELKNSNKDECVLYSTRYVYRYKNGIFLPPSSWIGSHGQMPEIKFKD